MFIYRWFGLCVCVCVKDSADAIKKEVKLHVIQCTSCVMEASIVTSALTLSLECDLMTQHHLLWLYICFALKMSKRHDI